MDSDQGYILLQYYIGNLKTKQMREETIKFAASRRVANKAKKKVCFG